MKKIIKAIGLIILIHVFAVYASYLIFTLLNLDFYRLFNQDLWIAFSAHSISIGFIYMLIRWFLGKWYKEAHQYPYQARILWIVLLSAYAIVFIAENQGQSYWEYFFWFNYPLGSFFKTVNADVFDFRFRLILLMGISVQSLSLAIIDAFDRLMMRHKKKSLKTSLTKQY